jgi:hypothetical protein
MAITILNPARFNDDGGVNGRQFIRAAFADEGYGVSSSFKAYAQGAGIVPATAAFDGIGAGTAGDPLRMSQFNGFVVPSLAFFTTSLTEGSQGTYGSGYARKGYSTSDPPSGDVLFAAGIGSTSNSTINKPGGGTTTFLQFTARQIPIKSSLSYSLVFAVSGDQTGTWWNTITYPTITMSRIGTGSYDSGTNTTRWSELLDAFSAFTGGTKTLTIT